MKFEFDSNNATELRAVEAAVAVLLCKQTAADHLEAAARRLTVGEVASVFDVPVEALKDLPGAVVSPDGHSLTGSGEVETIRVDDELDSAGQPWNPELHSSSRAKVADGTWKKKRGVGKVEAPDSALIDAARGGDPVGEALGVALADKLDAAFSAPTPPVPPVPPVPTPPAPQADGLVTMNDIWALVTNGKTTINVVLAAAQRMGFADLGKVAQTATAEQRAALLKELTA